MCDTADRRKDRHIHRSRAARAVPLADRQFGRAAQAILGHRLEAALVEPPVLLLAGRVLTPAERYDLLLVVQRGLLPELYADPPDPAHRISTPPARPLQ
jgi:hypothetical protein